MLEPREFAASAEELHALPMPVEGEDAQLWIMRPTDTALVMGSSQKPERFDQAGLASGGIALAPRRSGGGAVFIDPHATVWIDLLAPRSSSWWSNELAENFLLVGRCWQQAFRSLGFDTDLCTSPPARAPASALACWAGVGWGELTIDGAKVLGLSQRRTRWGSRVQAMAVLDDSAGRVGNYYLDQDEGALVHQHLSTTNVLVSQHDLETAVLAAFRAEDAGL